MIYAVFLFCTSILFYLIYTVIFAVTVRLESSVNFYFRQVVINFIVTNSLKCMNIVVLFLEVL